MVSMYSLGMGYGNMMGSMNSANVPQYFKNRYGYEHDFRTKPYAQPYPMAAIPRNPEPAIQKSWLGRFFARCFLS